MKVIFSSIQMNTLTFEDCLQSHLGYTTLFTSPNSVVNLAAIKGLAGAQRLLLALRQGRATQTLTLVRSRKPGRNQTATLSPRLLKPSPVWAWPRLNWLLWAPLLPWFNADFLLLVKQEAMGRLNSSEDIFWVCSVIICLTQQTYCLLVLCIMIPTS